MKASGFLNYTIDTNNIHFWCNGLDETDDEIAGIWNDFLLEIFENKNVFLEGFMVDKESIFPDKSMILEEVIDSKEPSRLYLKLKQVKVRSNMFYNAVEMTFYLFDNEVTWKDFLTLVKKTKRMDLVKKNMLSAYFVTGDCGADFWFWGSRDYEKQVFQLFEKLSDVGFEVKNKKSLMII